MGAPNFHGRKCLRFEKSLTENTMQDTIPNASDLTEIPMAYEWTPTGWRPVPAFIVIRQFTMVGPWNN